MCIRDRLKDSEKCLRDYQKGKLATSFEECIAGDSEGKVQKAMKETIASEEQKCAPLSVPPTIAYTKAADVNQNAVDGARALTYAIFGGPPVRDADLATKAGDKDTAKCQLGMLKGAGRLLNTVLGEADKARKAALKEVGTDGSSALVVELDKVFSNDAVAKAGGRLVKRVEKKCASLQDPAAIFPGACADPDLGAVEDCVIAAARCRACSKIEAFEGLGLDCDDLDDGRANASCP